MKDDEGNLFKVPFSDGIACCVMINGNMLVYNVEDLLDVCRIHTDSFAVETRLSALTLQDEIDLNSLTSCRFGIGKARKKGFTSSFSVLFTFPTNVFISSCFANAEPTTSQRI
jgi:hypothetical protein